MDPSKTDSISLITERVPVIACRKCKTKIDVSACGMFDVIACPACDTPQSVPVQLDHFLLLERVGSGGMAKVYRAFDTHLSRQVAIKVMRRELGSDPKFVQNFLREARNAAQINHRNVVQIYSVGEEKGQPYIVMELLDGGRLDAMIEQGQPLDEDFVLTVGLGIAEGLAAAAMEKQMVHGDVKPQNILFDRNGTPKIADFGLARSRTHQMVAGDIWGTPFYIAPEKARERKEDARSDIYSLGATMYHALANKPPFDAPTAAEVVRARLDVPAPNILEAVPNLRPGTVELITRMLEPDPARRYPNYVSLLSDMRKVVNQPPAPAVPAKAAAPADRSRRRMIFFAINTVALLAAGGAGYVLYRRRRGGTPAPREPGPITPKIIEGRPEATDPMAPFTLNQQRKMEELVGQFNREGYTVAVNGWADMAREFPPRHAGRLWMAVLTALPPWMDRNADLVAKRAGAVADLALPAPGSKALQPEHLPRQLALLLTGKEPGALSPDAPWPAWFRDLHIFLRGAGAAVRNEPEAAALLDDYLAATRRPDAQEWPYAFKPTARRLRDRLGATPSKPAPKPAAKPRNR